MFVKFSASSKHAAFEFESMSDFTIVMDSFMVTVCFRLGRKVSTYTACWLVYEQIYHSDIVVIGFRATIPLSPNSWSSVQSPHRHPSDCARAECLRQGRSTFTWVKEEPWLWMMSVHFMSPSGASMSAGFPSQQLLVSRTYR